MKPEYHIFIIWSEARYREKDIIKDLEKTFDVVANYGITWSKEYAYKNFSRFYAIKSRYARSKMKHCGVGEFLLIVIRDKAPKYVERQTNSGKELVNINVFDKKTLYRSWTGESHKIHATNNIQEVRHNLALFFCRSYEDFCSDLPESESRQYLSQDLVGTNGWNSFEELFFVMNNTFEYCMLRNFEGFFENMSSDEHLDIDILVNDYTEAKLVLSGDEVYPNTNRVVNSVLVKGESVNFDIRSVGDMYMCDAWAKEILNSRNFDEVGFFKPTSENYFYSLLYHALVHKEMVSSDYNLRLIRLANVINVNYDEKTEQMNILKNYMRLKGFTFSEPKDLSVFFNYQHIGEKCSNYRIVTIKFRVVRKFVKNILNKVGLI